MMVISQYRHISLVYALVKFKSKFLNLVLCNHKQSTSCIHVHKIVRYMSKSFVTIMKTIRCHLHGSNCETWNQATVDLQTKTIIFKFKFNNTAWSKRMSLFRVNCCWPFLISHIVSILTSRTWVQRQPINRRVSLLYKSKWWALALSTNKALAYLI